MSLFVKREIIEIHNFMKKTKIASAFKRYLKVKNTAVTLKCENLRNISFLERGKNS